MQAVVKARNYYQKTPLALIAGNSAEHYPSGLQQYILDNTLALDTYQHQLLRSRDDKEVLLGVRSIVHWTLQDKPDLLQQICSLIHKKPDADSVRIVRAGIASVDYEHYQQALLTTCDLFDGRLDLATTLLSFADPDNIGIFNSYICHYVASDSFFEYTGYRLDYQGRHVTQLSLIQIAERFQTYCHLLQSIQIDLNRTGAHWQDQSGSLSPRFRSIDVQRAISVMSYRSIDY